jgi:hypothetical protein
MMRQHLKIDELWWELRVNSMPVRTVHIRCASELADGFQIVIDDPQVGSISLHDGFELEMRQPGSPWRPVTLEQLKKTFAKSNEYLRPRHLPRSSERTERQLPDQLDDVDIPHRSSPRLGKIVGHVRCVKRVQAVLYEAAIPHQVSGTVFLVPDAEQARITLIRAGFGHSNISPRQRTPWLSRTTARTNSFIRGESLRATRSADRERFPRPETDFW